MKRQLSSSFRWVALTIVPPLLGIGSFAAIFAFASNLMYQGLPGSHWFEDSWALDAHAWPIVFAWVLLLLHGAIVLPTAVVRRMRHRDGLVPLAAHAIIAGGVLFLVAAGLGAPRSSLISGWLVPVPVLGVPIAVLLLSARAIARPSRGALPNVRCS